MIALIVWVICAVITAGIADTKGYNGFIWGIIGFLIGVFGIIIILLIPDKRKERE